MSDGQGKFVFYHYDPSLVSAIIFATLFSVTTMIHIYQMSKSRAWYMTTLIVGGICKYIIQTGTWIHSFQSVFVLLERLLTCHCSI
jgi:hypothetical protein